MKNTCDEIYILEGCSVSMNKSLKYTYEGILFFQFNILLVIFVIVLNAPLLYGLTLASVNLEIPCLFPWCIMK